MIARIVVVAWVIVMLVPISCAVLSHAMMTSRSLGSARYAHDMIMVVGDGDFAYQATAEGWLGNGTASNPYVIEHYLIDGSQYAISISHVSVTFAIRECNLSSTYITFPCISFNNVSHGSIEHCFVDSMWTGIGFSFVRDCTLDSNWIRGYHEVLSLMASYNCTFTSNIFANGGISFVSTDRASFCHTFSNNTVMGRPLGFFCDLTSWSFYGTLFGQMIIIGGSDCFIFDGDFWGVPCGVLLVGCQRCHIVSCTVSDTTFGVVLLDCANVIVSNCSLSSCIQFGLFINRSSSCTVSGNSIRSNVGVGIALGQSVSGSRLFSNVFDSNGVNARDDGSWNTWDDGIGTGNTWSDYIGVGAYTIGGAAGSVDHYPRMRVDVWSLNSSGIGFTLWFFMSVAVLGVPVFLMIQAKRPQSAETGL